ncbi:DoxX family protein [Rhodococcus tibetensis]|uniref:DoxX family protein n=1 Tax=Rhodococcus tibetensis TaxID=2965064 RepID=A0ABT1QAG3_9NOCA|nr:DoxX family protein [Rhodococcus sp. FXJ9.536]MCQ4119256.1 DoxX family protein [Rhodococcus sp. FXJ9.536]
MRKDPNESPDPGASDHGASPDYGKVSSPYDSPTERFPTATPVSGSGGRALPHTDDELDFGDAHGAGLPTEQIPAYRDSGSRESDQPTEVLGRPSTGSDATTGTSAVGAAGDGDVKIGRGTLDLGLLALRLAVGGTALVHGLQKLTGIWNGPGLDGFEDMLANAGFQQAKLLAILGAVGEVAGGALLILGLVTPLAAASVLAVMINAWAFRQTAEPGLEYFAPAGTEYETLLGVCAGVIILTGPGRISLDGRRGWATRPFIGSFVALILGVAAGVCTWIFLNGANPLI